MKSPAIERLLSFVRGLQLVKMILQLALAGAGFCFLVLISTAVSEKYLISYSWILPAACAPLMVFLAVRSFYQFFSATRERSAAWVDRRFGLKDRLSTYVQLANSDHPFLQPLIEETIPRMNNISAWRCASFSRGSRSPLLFAAIPAILLGVLPYLPVSQSIATRVEQHKRIAEQSKKLTEQAAKLEKLEPKNPEINKLSGEMRRLAAELQKPSTTTAEALKKLNAGQQRISDTQKQIDKSSRDELSRQLNEMAKDGKPPEDLSEAQKKQIQDAAKELAHTLSENKLEGGEELDQALKSGKMSKEQIDKMKSAIERYQQQKAQADQRMAELQKSLENTKKSATGTKSKVVYNSKIDDRRMETGKSGVDDGPGTTNKDVGPQKFDTQKHGKGEYAQDKTKAEYEQLYKGERTKAGDDPLFLNGQWDPENARFTKIRTFGMNSDSELSGGMQETVVQNDAESVIRKEKIPASYRNVVKKYFESIQPQ